MTKTNNEYKAEALKEIREYLKEPTELDFYEFGELVTITVCYKFRLQYPKFLSSKDYLRNEFLYRWYVAIISGIPYSTQVTLNKQIKLIQSIFNCRDIIIWGAHNALPRY